MPSINPAVSNTVIQSLSRLAPGAPGATGTTSTATNTPSSKPARDSAPGAGGQRSSLSLKPVRVDRNGDGVEYAVEKKLADGVRKARETMAQQDKDGNGKLEGAELTDALKAADTNGDGIVTRRELRRFNNKDISREERFKGFDSNGDGVLSGNELGRKKWAKGLDKDGDGKVTLEEFKQGRGAKPTTGETAEAAPTPATPAAPAQATTQTASVGAATVGAAVPIMQPSSTPVIL